MEIHQLYTCSGTISKIEWSFDSEYVLCIIPAKSIVEIWSRSNHEWKCTIFQKGAGISHARFSPDGRHILVTSDFQIKITVYSLYNQHNVATILNPKHTKKGLAFSPNGKYMALAERRDGKDYISIIITDTWEMVKSFSANTKHLSDLAWSPDGRMLVLWDDLISYRVSVHYPDGTLLHTYSAYDNALGVKSLNWESTSRLLAVGSYDEKIRIINQLTWKVIAEFDHKSSITTGSPAVFREAEYTGTQDGPRVATQSKTRYVIQELPIQLKSTSVDFNKSKPKKGVGLVKFSYDSKFIISINDNMPRVLWIWSTSRLDLAAMIIQMQPIKCVEWDPLHTRLALCTGNSRIYMWSLDGCSCVELPNIGCNVQKLQWNTDGESLVLKDEHNFCVCYPTFNNTS